MLSIKFEFGLSAHKEALNNVIGSKSIREDLVSVEFDQSYSLPGSTYDIKIIASDTEYEVTIDADTGEMLSAKQDKLDADDIA
ncbi:PepSY domain-containing protein [Psychrobacter sp. 72-O-c]|uniref:PepSY domain-containing protein n=1 Tax=Psychrobacter sp. 72-O-c TaxID=2774125 RepID=UPI00191A04C1|nr:PepSY domain-containing protein [Psychrobacter sp. 72-O-c]